LRTTIESGTIVSHYRIVAPIGAGGMGEVYKAHDHNLERSVALKILPPDLVKNDERVRRFMLEAKSASSLNHPHIVTIHEIGEARVSSSDGDGGESEKPIHYIAMELIDGSTLKSKIHHEETELRTLLSYLAQAADGLAKAHGAGIVHRDLKPENIMVTRDGFAKVLDFGLAKLTLKRSTPDESTLAMAAREETREGSLLGTVGYMSPEQVGGKLIDHRSDIFSFGAILYEAATRRRPFEADSDVDVMHKILHDKPPAVDELNPAAPAELRRMIRRCLAKDPDKRYQSMKDLSLELSEIVDEFEQLSISSSARASSSVSGATLPPRSSRRVVLIASVVLMLALAAIAVAVWNTRRQPVAAVSTEPVPQMAMQPLTSSGNVWAAAISPDGKYVAHLVRDEGRFSLWVRQIATGSDVPVVPALDAGVVAVRFSPDGNYIYYIARDKPDGHYSWLYQVPTLGGSPRKVLYDVDTPVSFSPDGKRMVFGRGNPPTAENHLVTANADGSGEQVVARFKRFRRPFAPSWSPDGAKIVTPVIDITGGWKTQPVEVTLATGAKRVIGNTPWLHIGDISWLGDGSALVMSARAPLDAGLPQVWLQPYPDGAPVRITNDTDGYEDISLAADQKTMSVVRWQERGILSVADPSDATGGKRFGKITSGQPAAARVSDDGAVVLELHAGSATNVAIIDRADAPPRVLTSDGTSFDPDISRDGRTIVFTSARIGRMTHLFLMNADGSGLRQLTNGAGEFNPDITADGSTVVYGSSGNALWIVSTKGGAPRRLTAYGNLGPRISPDGKLVMYTEWNQGAHSVSTNLKVVPAAGGPPILDVPFPSGIQDLQFHSNGKAITFHREIAGVANVYSIPLTGGEPKQVTKFTERYINSLDWTADGRLVLVRDEGRADVMLLTNFARRSP
jgi:serine/threonine protein kinase